MSKSREFSPFKWVDTYGIPLEMIINSAERQGYPGGGFTVICEFASGAIRAGWKKEKIFSEIREMKNFGLDIPTFFEVDVLKRLERWENERSNR